MCTVVGRIFRGAAVILVPGSRVVSMCFTDYNSFLCLFISYLYENKFGKNWTVIGCLGVLSSPFGTPS